MGDARYAFLFGDVVTGLRQHHSCGTASTHPRTKSFAMKALLNSAAISPEVDVQARAEAIAIALADLGQPAAALGEMCGIHAFRHEHDTALQGAHGVDDRVNFCKIIRFRDHELQLVDIELCQAL